MAINWKKAQENEARFWQSVYVEKRKDFPTYMPIKDDLALAFTRKSIERFGHTLEAANGKTIIDVGCGPYGLIKGYYIHFQRTGRGPAQMYGIDPLIETYRQFGTLAEADRIKYFPTKAEMIPLANSSCDYVYSTNVIDHVENPERVLMECRRICARGGEVAFAVHVVNPTFSILRPFLFLIDRNHPHHFSRKSIVDLAQKHFTHVVINREVNILEDHPEFTFMNTFRSPGIFRGLKRWISTFLLSTCYLVCKNP